MTRKGAKQKWLGDAGMMASERSGADHHRIQGYAVVDAEGKFAAF